MQVKMGGYPGENLEPAGVNIVCLTCSSGYLSLSTRFLGENSLEKNIRFYVRLLPKEDKSSQITLMHTVSVNTKNSPPFSADPILVCKQNL